MATLELQQPTWIAGAPITFRIERELVASPHQVWDVLVDYDRWTEWVPGVKSCHSVGESTGIGSTRFIHLDAFKVTEQITAWEPGRTWAMSVQHMNVPLLRSMAECVTISGTETGGSQLVWETGAMTKPWAAPIRSILVSNNKRSLTEAIEGLDGYIASGVTSQSDSGSSKRS